LSDVEHYLRKAEPHRSVRSSIPPVFEETRKAAEKAEKAAENAKDSVDRLRNMGFIALAVTLLLLISH